MGKCYCDAPRDCGCTIWDHGKVSPVCAELDCPNYVKPERPTNADRIRAMSDEELADWLTEFAAESFAAGMMKFGETMMSKQARFIWLTQPAQEE